MIFLILNNYSCVSTNDFVDVLEVQMNFFPNFMKKIKHKLSDINKSFSNDFYTKITNHKFVDIPE